MTTPASPAAVDSLAVAATARAAGAPNKFDIAFFKAVAGPENCVVSPVSVRLCLALAAAGARGETYDRIAATLCLAEKREQTIKGVSVLASVLRSPVGSSETVVNISNGVFVDDGAGLNGAYIDDVKSMAAVVASLPLRNQSAVSAFKINSWVSDATRGMIKQVVTADDLREAVTLLVNAVYFKGKWSMAFDPARTHIDLWYDMKDFARPEKRRFMWQHGDYVYGEDDDVQFLDLMYKGGDYGMSVILPKLKDGEAYKDTYGRVVNNLTNDSLDKWSRATGFQDGQIMLPKFRVEFAVDGLGDLIASLGAAVAFSDAADFGNMSDYGVKLGKCVQKCVFECDEEGVEAAAATTTVALASCARPSAASFTFKADRPFLFALRHRRTGANLFLGHVMSPEQAGP